MTDHKIISRKTAKLLGLKFYFTGKPCHRGHIDKRIVSCLVCFECNGINRKAWRAENPERTRELRREWAKKNPEKEKISHKKSNGKWWAVVKDDVNEKRRAERAANPEKFRQQQKASLAKNYAADPQRFLERARLWKLENPEKAREMQRKANAKWLKKNPDAPRAKMARRRAASGSYTQKDISDLLRLQRRKCAYCKTKLTTKYHVDHITPLSRGGTNDRQNLQITCVKCNLGKGARDPIFHAQALGMLL